MGLFRLWDENIFRLNLWGETEEEYPALRRPFPQPPSPLAGLMSAFNGPSEEPAAPVAEAAAAGERPRVEVLDEGEEEEAHQEPKKTK